MDLISIIRYMKLFDMELTVEEICQNEMNIQLDELMLSSTADKLNHLNILDNEIIYPTNQILLEKQIEKQESKQLNIDYESLFNTDQMEKQISPSNNLINLKSYSISLESFNLLNQGTDRSLTSYQSISEANLTKQNYRSTICVSSSSPTLTTSTIRKEHNAKSKISRSLLIQILKTLELYALNFSPQNLTSLQNLKPDIMKSHLEYLYHLLLNIPDKYLNLSHNLNKNQEQFDLMNNRLNIKEILLSKQIKDVNNELMKLKRNKYCPSSDENYKHVEDQNLLITKQIRDLQTKLNQFNLAHKCVEELLHKNKSVDRNDSSLHKINKFINHINYESPNPYDSSEEKLNNLMITLEYVLRLLHIRDTELLFLLAKLNEKPEVNIIQQSQQTLSQKQNLSDHIGMWKFNHLLIPTSDYIEDKLKKFCLWENVSVIDCTNLPVHRLEYDSFTDYHSLFSEDKTVSGCNDLSIEQNDAEYHPHHQNELMNYIQHVLNQLEQYICSSKLNQNMTNEIRTNLTKLLNLIELNDSQEFVNIKSSNNLLPSDSFSYSIIQSKSNLSTHPITKPTVLVTTKSIPTTTTTASSSIKTKKLMNDKSKVITNQNLSTYPKRANYKTSITDLVNSVDYLDNLNELRDLIKYLLDQYHIVTAELDLQMDTNWCLRQRLTNANNQLIQVTEKLSKGNQSVVHLEERLSLEASKHTILTEQCDLTRQQTRQAQEILNKLREKHGERQLKFVPDTEIIQTCEHKESPISFDLNSSHKWPSTSTDSKLLGKIYEYQTFSHSQISDPQQIIIRRTYIPFKTMYSVSCQTEKHNKVSCFPRGSLPCGPLMKRSAKSASNIQATTTTTISDTKRSIISSQLSEPSHTHQSSQSFNRHINICEMDLNLEQDNNNALSFVQQQQPPPPVKHKALSSSQLQFQQTLIKSDKSDDNESEKLSNFNKYPTFISLSESNTNYTSSENQPLLSDYKSSEQDQLNTVSTQSSSILSLTSLESHSNTLKNLDTDTNSSSTIGKLKRSSLKSHLIHLWNSSKKPHKK